MAWCEQCDRYLTPTSLSDQGHCPFCDGQVVPGEGDQPLPSGEPARKAPWHFKMIVLLTAAYLLWRLVQLIMWLF